MSIKVKAVERNVSFDKSKEKWAYVMQAELYSKLTQSKVIQEAALRSGISKGSINAAWDAIGDAIKAWATEGHSVAIPGLGSMRFGLRATSVTDANLVGANLITSRRVIFTPNTDIKDELARTSVNITCYDRNGEVVKRVTSSDDGMVDDPENPVYLLTLMANDDSMGTVSGGGSYAPDTEVQLKAEPKSGYEFVKWSDGDTNATRTYVTTSEPTTLTAEFKQSGGGNTDEGGMGDIGE